MLVLEFQKAVRVDSDPCYIIVMNTGEFGCHWDVAFNRTHTHTNSVIQRENQR